MIYWFKNLPSPLYDDKWKPVISYKWLRESFMAAVYLSQFVLFILFMIYTKNYIPKVMKYDLNLQVSIPQWVIYISVIAMLIIHEILHVAVILNKGDFSITFSNLFFWVTTNAELSKFRYFIYIFLPLLIFTVIPFIISLFISNDLAHIIRIIAFGHILFSPADIINSIFTLTKPNKAIFCRGMYYI